MDERLRQRDLVKEQLIGSLETLIEECKTQIDYIRRRGSSGLGGQLQNVWDIFYKMGELNILAADYLFDKKEE